MINSLIFLLDYYYYELILSFPMTNKTNKLTTAQQDTILFTNQNKISLYQFVFMTGNWREKDEQKAKKKKCEKYHHHVIIDK